MRPLNERQLETLAELYGINHLDRYPKAWATPLDFGGSNGSHHSATLTSLAARGLAQSKQRGAADPAPGCNAPPIGPGQRGAKAYRITPEGIALHMENKPK